MKKALYALALAALVAVATAGCGSSDSESTSKKDAEVATTTTAAPTTTTTAAPKNKTAAQVVDGLRAAGLPVGAVEVYDSSNDPNELLGRPGQYTGKASFADTRIGTEVNGVDGGGDVETFDDEASLTKRFEYLGLVADKPPLGGWYQYKAGNAILRVPYALTPEQAKEYEAAFQVQFK